MQLDNKGGQEMGVSINHIHMLLRAWVAALLFLAYSAIAISDSNIPRTCGSVEITGDVFRRNVSLPKKFRHCQIMEGHLRIQLVEDYYENEGELIANLGFPDLVQVTGYVMIYRVFPLRNLDDLLPNLSVIRGHELFHGYALIVFGNTYLEKLGLNNLTDILNGSVRIEKNWILCPGIDTRWNNITRHNNTNEVSNVIKDNYIYCIYDPCEVKDNCNTVMKPHHKICSTIGGGCYQGPQCHPECAGGCLKANNSSACVACRHFLLNDTCVPSCAEYSSHYVTDRKYICLEKSKWNGTIEEQAISGHCKSGSCSKEPCVGTTITSNDLGKSLRDCTNITGNLIISVAGGRNVAQQLEENLKNIREVTGYLRVYGSRTLFSLNFLKNLEMIHGKEKVEQRYALYVMENENLQELWDFSQRSKRFIIGNNASIFFQYNPKLCPDLIYNLAAIAGVTNLSIADVSNTTNGQTQPCYEYEMEASVVASEEFGSINVTWSHIYNGNDNRIVIGYYVYYTEAAENVTLFGKRDACNDEELWDRSFWEDKKANKKGKPYRTETVGGLKPYTQYAVYVMAYYTDQVKNGNRSQILYVTTLPTNPSPVLDIQVTAKTSTNITLKWKKPAKPNGDLILYRIIYKVDNSSRSKPDKVCDPHLPLNEVENPPSNTSVAEGNMTSSANNQSSHNVTRTGCCACQDQHQYFNSARIKNDRQSDIAFENYLDEILYSKMEWKYEVQPTSKAQSQGGSGETKDNNTTVPKSTSSTVHSINENHKSQKPHDKTPTPAPNKSLTKVVPPFGTATGNLTSSDTSIVLTNLTYYTKYEISIRACNTGTNTALLCSNWRNFSAFTDPDKTKNAITEFTVTPEREYIHGEKEMKEIQGKDSRQPQVTLSYQEDRTQGEGGDSDLYFQEGRLESNESFTNADNPDTHVVRNRAKISKSNNSIYDKNLILSWISPPNPNGPPWSYFISVIDLDAKEGGKLIRLDCITEEEAQSDRYTYRLNNLHSWNYNISIKLRSEGTEGEFSTVIVQFPDFSVFWTITLPLLCGICMGTCTIELYARYKKWRRGPEPEEQCIITVNRQYGELLGCALGKIDDKYIIDPMNLEIDFEKKLGKGCFGVVYQGLLKDASGHKKKVAVKDLNKADTFYEAKATLQEVHHMQDINSNFIVPLVGVMAKMPHIYVVMELMERGDLRSFLLSEDGCTVTPEKMIEMAVEAADGMAYLAAKKLVHRDLAARNCMLDINLTLKIGDFGLTRYLAKDYYKKKDAATLPVRWLAPEALEYGRYTARSDIWSYGILLWEIYKRGVLPYQGYVNEQVYQIVISGMHLEKPPSCPDFMFTLMLQCWKRNPKERPTFIQLIRLLLPRTSQEYLAYVERVSFFHKSSGCDSESTEDNDEGFINSGSLDISLEENDEYPYSNSFPPSLDHVEDDQVCLTSDDHYKRSSCASMSCISGSLTSQGIRLTPTRDTPYKLPNHMSSCFAEI